jgi:hypothetical protein
MARPRTRWKKPSGVTPLTVIRQLRAGDAKPGHQISSTGPKRVCEFCDFQEDERETHDVALQDVAAQRDATTLGYLPDMSLWPGVWA